MRYYKWLIVAVLLVLALTIGLPRGVQAANYGACSYGERLFNDQCSSGGTGGSGDSGSGDTGSTTTSGGTTASKSKAKSSSDNKTDDGTGSVVGTTDDTDTGSSDGGTTGNLPDTGTQTKKAVDWRLMGLGVGAILLGIIIFSVILSRRRRHQNEDAVLIS